MSGDGLRDELVKAVTGWHLGADLLVDMRLLPVVQAHIDAAREQVAEPWASLVEQYCAEGIHVKWYVDDEDAHACPWCVEASLLRRLDAANDRFTAAVARAEAAEADATNGWGLSAVLLRRAEAAEQAVQRVRAITYALGDGTEYEHNGHASHEGEPECPGCWAATIRRALDGTP